MGPGRGGAYTCDWIERRLGIDIHNTDRVIPELQDLKVGEEIDNGQHSRPAGSAGG